MKLQKREKILLVILILIVVIVLPAVFLIYPAARANTEKANQLIEAAAQQYDMETTIATKPSLEATLDSLQQQYAQDENLIPGMMKTYDIHYFVNDICSKAGVTLSGLAIGDYAPLQQTGEDGQTTESSLAFKATLQLTLAGDFDQLLAVMDAFSECAYTDVASFYVDLTSTAAPSAPPAESVEPSPTATAASPVPETVIAVDLYAVAHPGDEAFTAMQEAADAQALAEAAEQAALATAS